jgi:hypothetical protein
VIRRTALAAFSLVVAACATPVPSPSSVPPRTATAAPQPTGPFDELAARAVALPDVPARPCPISPATEIDDRVAPALGEGPVFAVIAPPRWPLAGQSRTAFERYPVKTLWVSTDARDGHVLVRIARIEEPASNARVPGFMQGAAHLPGDVYTQLRLGPAGSVSLGPGPMPEGWRAWSSTTLVDGPGCYVFQIDTKRTTAHVVFEVVL